MSAMARWMDAYRDKVYFVLILTAFMLLTLSAVPSANWFMFAVPFVPFVAWYAIADFRRLWLITVFMVPLSFNLQEFVGDAALTFPTDLLAILLTGLVLFKMISEGRNYSSYFRHPITIVIAVYLLWLIFPAINSEMPIVSWKYLAAYSWMLGAFYLMPTMLFENQRTMFRFFQLIGIAYVLTFVVVMGLYLGTGRNPFLLRFNPGPFFADHTVFGAFTAMWVPIFFLISFFGKFTPRERLLARGVLFFVLVGLFFSYSRGAWMSMLAAMFLMMCLKAGKWFRRLILPASVGALVILGYFYYMNMGSAASRNDAVSRKNFADHVASVTNFKTDFSNAERINRWAAAWQMFEESPWMGKGPGTYAMLYGDYQKSKYRTPVSTNHGDNGTAHNEFLLAMSESGWMAGVILLVLFALPIWRGIRGYLLATEPNTKLLYLGVTFALVAYDIHSLVNNFLDQDKVGVSYYGMLAIIVALDIHFLPKERQQKLADQPRSSLPT